MVLLVAGNRILNTRPPTFSCGTMTPIWTDERMPSRVGVLTTVRIHVELVNKGTRTHENVLSVIKCSRKPNDYVYRLSNYYGSSCHAAFCGMK